MYEREDITQFTNEELKKELRKFNIIIGPITNTTRRIYENRLFLFLERHKRNDPEKREGNKDDDDDDNSSADDVVENTETNTEEVSKQDEEEGNKIEIVDTEKRMITNNNNDSSESSQTNESPQTNERTVSKENEEENTTNANTEPQVKEDVKEAEEISDGFFYGVWVPYSPLRISNQNKPYVFCSKNSALKAMKKFTGSRFKQFKTNEEAEQFSLTEPQLMSVDNIIEMVASSSLAKKVKENTAKPEVKTPTFQEVQIFRTYIEQNDIENVKKCLQNPKYLINTKDIPVVLHEGSRLNAMHVAVKYNQLDICKMIMCRLHDADIFKLIYPDVAEDHFEFRRNHIIKLYLNSPEKIMCDTPLHLACKYGFVDIVKFLLSFPIIKINATNKDGKLPANIICTRSSLRGQEKIDLIHTLSTLFEDKVYIPLYHGDTIAKVGEPIVTVIPDPSSVFSKEMRACIGPLSPSKAHSFRCLWKRSPREKKFQSIVRSDYEKGMERIGRSLASIENLPFAEYWEFLDGFANLSTNEGLQELEQFLLAKTQRHTSSCDIIPATIPATNSKQNQLKNDVVDNSSMADARSRYHENNRKSEVPDGIKRRLSFDDDSPPPVVIDIDKLTVEFKASCTLEDATESLPSCIIKETTKSPSKDEVPIDSEDGQMDTDFVTPGRKELPQVYIYGDRPSKQDMDVLRAIDNLDQDLTGFPHIRNWQKRLHQRQDRESWPSPGTPRYKSSMMTFDL